MKMPDVCNELRDPTRQVVYRVIAYRTLTRQEMLTAVAMHRGQNKGRPPKKNSTITIVTLFGVDGS